MALLRRAGEAVYLVGEIEKARGEPTAAIG